MASLHTDRLELRLADDAHLAALVQGGSAFEAAFGLRVEPGYLEFPEALEYMVEVLRRWGDRPEATWWRPWLLVRTEEGAVVGLAGFKGQPEDGVVEIGYGVATGHRNRGYATEAARALIAWALKQEGVHTVCAHTLPERGPSARVLEKCGLRQVGEEIDPEDGPVWRWETQRRTQT